MKNVEEKVPNNIPRKFIVDSMFGTVARKLRILGFDTYYQSDFRDQDVMRIGGEQNRTIITADKELFSRSVNKKIPAILLNARNDVYNVGRILGGNAKMISFSQTIARCSKCNGKLKESPKEAVKTRVEDGVFQNYNFFSECIDCSKVYWMGTHVVDIQLWVQRLNEIINSYPCT